MRKKFKVVVNGREYTVEIEEIGGSESVEQITPVARSAPAIPSNEKPQSVSSESVEGAVVAPMPGKIMDVKVSEGDTVKKGDILVLLEAMKMENEIVASRDGTVKEVRVKPGDNVDRGAILVVIG